MSQTCRHPGCRCESQPEFDGYCSADCASAGSIRQPTGACECGHPACSTAAYESEAQFS
jgi:hypothetical protein